MSNGVAISARNLGKCYKRRVAGSYSNSLRDAVKGGVAALLSAGRRSSAYEDFWALRDASFDIARGENVGIIGLNGAGKSTLLKVLSRITTPTTGSARIVGRMGSLLEVGTGFHGELTGRENTFLYGSILGMTRAEVASKFEAIVEFAEIGKFIDTPVKRYSSGMYVRLAFAVAAHLDPDILLLDEVLAVGDFTFQRKCMAFAAELEKKGATILFVSHNMFSIKTMCHRVIYLKNGKVIYDGPTDQGLKMYEKDSRLATPAWFQGGNAAPPIEITDFSLHNDKGDEIGMIDHGQSLTVRMKYKVQGRVERPDIRVGFNRGDDIHCMSYSSFFDGVEIPFLSGEGVIELRTPPISLVSDIYTTNVVVHDGGHGPILCAYTGESFHVRHPIYDEYTFGVFHETGKWKINATASKTKKELHDIG